MEKGRLLFAAVMAILGLTSCTNQNAELEYCQGYWVDLNSETALNISGSKMTVTGAGAQATYTIKIEKDGDGFQILNADGDGFDTMSELHKYQDGVLIATEMVLDEQGHIFTFLREEDKAEQLKLKDLSTDMPKTITSDVIVRFELEFTNRGQYNLSDNWPKCRYDWTIDRKDDGTWNCDYIEMYDSSVGSNYHGEVSEEFIKNLADHIRQSGAIEHNGYYMANKADGTDYSLRVVYDSGEELKIIAKGNAGDTCIFDLEILMDAWEDITPIVI